MVPHYGCFFLHQLPQVGWIPAPGDKRVQFVLPDGTTVRRAPRDVLLGWRGEPLAAAPSAAAAPPDAAAPPVSGPVPSEQVQALAQLEARQAQLAQAPLDMTALYKALAPGVFHDLETLAARFLPEGADGWQRAALLLALLRDGKRFRFNAGQFAAMDEHAAADRNAREAARNAQRAWEERAERWREAMEQGRWEPESPQDIEVLLSLLTEEKRSPWWESAARPLGLSRLHALDLELRLKTWLVRGGHWPGWPSVWLHRAEVTAEFPEHLLLEAQRMAAAPVAVQGRSDYRSADTYTIDGPGTRDFDDAVSVLAATPAGLRIAVHIAAPGGVLADGEPLFMEAARRIATVYTPGAVFPMLPPALSEQRYSLLQGEAREALSFVFAIDVDGARLQAIEPSVVRVNANLTPEQADVMLEERPEWAQLSLLVGSLTEARAQRGAHLPTRRDVRADPTDPEAIQLVVRERSAASHQLVEELAILTNSAAGDFCREQRVPALYRVQPWSPRPGEEGQGPPPPRYGITPQPHKGLGCESYVLNTSPLRRFPDLLSQRQILTHLGFGGDVIADRGRLEEWALRSDQRLDAFTDLSRRIGDYWKRRYLVQQMQKDAARVYTGEAQPRSNKSHGRVMLEEVRMWALCILPTEVREGDTLPVRIAAVDEDRRTVWAEPA